MSFQPTTFPTKTHPMPLQRSIGIRTAALQGFHINGEFDGIYSCLGPEIIQTCLQSQLPTMEVHGRKLGSAGIHHVDVPWWSGEPMNQWWRNKVNAAADIRLDTQILPLNKNQGLWLINVGPTVSSHIEHHPLLDFPNLSKVGTKKNSWWHSPPDSTAGYDMILWLWPPTSFTSQNLLPFPPKADILNKNPLPGES